MMKTLRYQSPIARDSEPTLLVLLPGAGMAAEDFETHGFIAAVQHHLCCCDVLAVETGVETYLDDDITPRLHHEVIAPARGAGIERLWLAGISVGGFGALSYLKEHSAAVTGLLLLAPFIGSRGLIAKVEEAGGIQSWSRCDVAGATPQHRLLEWLAGQNFCAGAGPTVHLGFGLQDRFAAAHRLLAGLLPTERVTTLSGGHDWPTWEVLWPQLLDKALREPSGEA